MRSELEKEGFEEGWNGHGRWKLLTAIATAIATAIGAAGAGYHYYPSELPAQTQDDRMAARLNNVEVAAAVNRARIEALESGQSTPISKEARSRIEALEEDVRENTRRLDQILLVPRR